MTRKQELKARLEALADLIDADLSPVEALESFVPAAENDDERSAWIGAMKEMEQGATLAEALRDRPLLLGRGSWKSLDVSPVELAAACRSLAVRRDLDEADGEVSGQGDEALERFLAWIHRAYGEGASDVHLEPNREGGRVRFRLREGLVERGRIAGDELVALVAAAKASFHGHPEIRDLPQDGKLILQIGGDEVTMRIATTPWIDGEALVLRFAPQQAPWKIDLATLTQDESLAVDLAELAERPDGLVVICGPTGSGKTTTLYALVGHRNRSDQKIVSVEDPVECRIPGVSQLQVDPNRGLSYATALRHSCRFDADVIMAGEIRDAATAQVLLQIALSGHTAFTQLYGTDALSGLQRLLDVGLDPMLLGDGLAAMVGQRLVGRLCPRCRVEDVRGPEERRAVDPDGLLEGRTLFRRGPGCPDCAGGCTGALAVLEILPMSGGLRKALAEGRRGQALRDEAKALGHPGMKEHALRLVARGLTSLREVEAFLGPDRR